VSTDSLAKGYAVSRGIPRHAGKSTNEFAGHYVERSVNVGD
jgi:hypothetical protein